MNIKVDHMSLGTANAQVERLLDALQRIADKETNIEADEFAKNVIADEVAYLRHMDCRS